MSIQVLQRVLKHATGEEAAGAAVPAPEPLPSVPRSWRQIPMSDSNARASEALQDHYSQSLQDLQRLLDVLLPGTALAGLGDGSY